MVILHLHKSQKSEWLQSLLHKPAVLHCCCFSNCPEHHGSAGVCDSSRRSRRDCRTALGCNRAVQCSDMSWNSHVLEASFDTCCLCVWQAVEVLQHSVHTGKMITVKMAVATGDAFRCQVCATAPFQNRQLLCGLSWKSRLCEHSRAAPVQSEVRWVGWDLLQQWFSRAAAAWWRRSAGVTCVAGWGVGMLPLSEEQ